MEIKVSVENGRVPVTVLHVDGNIDSATYEAFQSKANEAIQNGARYVLVDLTHVPFMSSAGLRALHSIFNQLRTLNKGLSEDELHHAISAGTYKSPDLKLLNISQAARAGFEMAGFDMYIETFNDMQKAIASF
jgi:anti-anti-sigma factor